MAHGVNNLASVRFSQVWGILLQCCILCLLLESSIGMRVHLKYSSDDVTSKPVPDAVNVTVSVPAGSPTILHLRRVPDQTPNVPVFTLSTGPDGKLIYTKEILKNVENVAFYQDVSNEAVIQVTKVDENGGKVPRLILKGEFRLKGQRYAIGKNDRRKRNSGDNSSSSSLSFSSSSSSTSSSSGDEEYEIQLEAVNIATNNDYLEAPPETMKFIQQSLQRPGIIKDDVSSSSSSSDKSSSHKSSSSSSRARRQSDSYNIDVVAVADYGMYRRFLERSGSRTTALQDLREYLAFIFSGVDLRYQSITSLNRPIRVHLTKIVITETASAATFTEPYKVSDTRWDDVDASSALSAFSEFAGGTGADYLEPYDHAMLFTGYDLTSLLTGSTKTNSTTGLAYTSTMCRTDGMSVSVVEDLGGFQSEDTAAHELGHGLSARHDGDDNRCSSSDRYIMAAGSSRRTEANEKNPWKFSSCSVDQFDEFLTRQMRTSRGSICLTQSLATSDSVPDVSGRLPGQEISPDDQCRMIYGSQSRLCRGSEFGVASDICISMYCFDPSTTGTCYEQKAIRGTSCGDGKICLDGACVADSRGTPMDEDCPYGDQPGIAFEGQTCPQFVNGLSGYCYQSVVRGRCCASCKDTYRMITDCEYGDIARNCISGNCPSYSTGSLRQCCRTCNYGTPFTTTPKPTAPTTTTTTTITTTMTTPTTTTSTLAVCADNPRAVVVGNSCPVAIARVPGYCYNEEVRQVCCASCRNIFTGVTGCEYGDSLLGCSSIRSACSQQERLGCCATCSRIDAATTRVTTTTSTTTLSTPTAKSKIATAEPTSACVDNASKRLTDNNHTCGTAVSLQPELCYFQDVSDLCCRSCQLAHTGLDSCRYGDKDPALCQQINSCQGHEIECCHTCQSFSSASRLPGALLLPLFVLVLVELGQHWL